MSRRRQYPSIRCLWLPKTKQTLCRRTWWSGENGTTRELVEVNCPKCLAVVESHRRK